MKSSDNIDRLAQAMVNLQKEIQDPGKSESGYENRYQYADLGAILKLLRPVAAKHGLAFIQFPVGAESFGVSTRILHESGQWIEEEFYIPREAQKGLSTAQTVGSIITYARRYAITAAFGMAQIDNDAALADMQMGIIRATADVIMTSLVEKDDEMVVMQLRSLSQPDQETMFNKTAGTGGMLTSKEKQLIRETESRYVKSVAVIKDKLFESNDLSVLIEGWRELTVTENVVMWGMLDDGQREAITLAKEAA